MDGVPDAPTLPGRSGALFGTPASYNHDGSFHYFQKKEKVSSMDPEEAWEYMGRYKKSEDTLQSYGSSKCMTEQNKKKIVKQAFRNAVPGAKSHIGCDYARSMVVPWIEYLI